MIAFLAVNILGAALTGDTLYTWGDRLQSWILPSLHQRTLATPIGPFGAAGCTDGSGTGLFLQEADRLVYRKAPDWKSRTIDGPIDMIDCLAGTLLGRRGVLVLHRGMQLRFYDSPDYHYTDIYSFYSASRQGGLMLNDIDRDGHLDIFCGNYWMRSPAKFKLPWHIFAIELYNQEPRSATLGLALEHGDLIVAQGELPEGLVSRLRKPEDPRKLWTEIPLGSFIIPGRSRPDCQAS